ncbi:OsmC family protein [Acidianus manzaensis]|uniref:Peroxiredoxin n=1 Tax=Acidianus manzaensis TaxID=282676 RepID=A0A1W6K2N3_9CREN|nr:OsmC family protein [Acidianus manzaensis]ARM76786.1 peroxiredoxin [Acidianus manzaensis]
MMTFTAEGKLEGDVAKISINCNEYQIGLFGSDYPTPEEMLLGSALSCLLLTIYYVAKEKDVKIDEAYGYIEGTMDPRGFQGDPNVPPGLLEVNYEITVKSKDDRIKEVLEESEKRCPLKDTLSRPIKINVKWNLKS